MRCSCSFVVAKDSAICSWLLVSMNSESHKRAVTT